MAIRGEPALCQLYRRRIVRYVDLMVRSSLISSSDDAVAVKSEMSWYSCSGLTTVSTLNTSAATQQSPPTN